MSLLKVSSRSSPQVPPLYPCRGGKITVEEALKLREPHRADDPAVIKHLIDEAVKGLKTLGIKRDVTKDLEKSFRKVMVNLRVQYEGNKIPSLRALIARTLALGPELL